ncbi:MAG: glycoside hydrolase family 44 protein [Chloroflexota bacterium]|nr:glycoside hydrolase family 44 protein [Chloroflexota bacterium]
MKRLSFLFIACLLLTVSSAFAQTSLTIYNDALASGWQSWSWSTTLDTNATAPVQAGNRSIAATYTAAWAGVYLRSQGALPAGYSTLRFWIHGGATGGQNIRVDAYNEAGAGTTLTTLTAMANTWTQHDLPLATFGPSSLLWGIVWQENSGGTPPTFYLDSIELIGGAPVPPPPAGQGPALRVDAAADVRPINPHIYGINFASPDLITTARIPVSRWGGNSTTRYNYLLDVRNTAADYFFQNIPNDVADIAQLPNGSAADQFVGGNRSRGVDSLMTMPLIGWTPRSRTYAECGYRVSVYGAQQQVDQWYPDCGNGIRTNGTRITGNNPLDTSIAIDEAWVQDWMRHLIAQFGTAANGGVRFYALDNEPSLWQDTHRDVRQTPLSSVEIRDLGYRYGAAIKAVDPGALLFGPVEFGWTGYYFSGVDQASEQWANPPEAALRGGLPFAPWYLAQMRAYEQQNGTRLLDYFTLHYYPAAPGVTLSSAGNAQTQALRLRTTRSLWDPTYVDESWIGEPVRLIPRMREWVNQHYPGTRLAITEYNFGGLEHINGALAQADVLGIFGREGLDFATLWSPPEATQPGAFAFRMYRNYDGSGGAFGETSVRAQSDDQAQLAVYAATRADGVLTIMVINKTGAPLTSPLTISSFNSTTAQVYRYADSDWTRITREPDATISGGAVSLTYPANSITLLVVAPGSTSGSVNGQVGLQGRTAGTSAMIVPLTIERITGGTVQSTHTPTSDMQGAFTLNPLPSGAARLRVKAAGYLASAQDVTLAGGANAVSFGTLRAGDVNGDNSVTLLDFSALASAYNRTSGQPGWNANADLNGDGGVTLIDFSLLASNFNQTGA